MNIVVRFGREILGLPARRRRVLYTASDGFENSAT